ncbi:MAG: adenylate/guanylate cyclase domain-containing protein [Nitrospira sp.]|nr:adenylate/guanylate cyclase domain-containing protein [Nitrospira sp.]
MSARIKIQQAIGAWVVKPTIIAPLIITIILAVFTVKNPSFIDEHIETLLVDYRFKIRNILDAPTPPDNILIVSIDEKSLAEYGRWPWSRKLQAELIKKVFESKPKVVAVDIFYPESETPEADEALAKVMNSHRDRLVVALGFEIEEGKAFTGEVHDLLYDHTISRIRNLKYLSSIKQIEAFSVLLPPEPIASSVNFAHVYPLPDRDGKLRWENLYIKYGDEYFPSIALQAARISKGIATDKLSIVGGEGVDLDGMMIPTDKFGRLHINYLGKEGVITHISAADVLSDKISRDVLKDRIVLIGTSAMATYDQKITPFSANMPGVEKNATVVANIINTDFIKKSPIYIDLLIVLIMGISALLIGRWENAFQSLVLYLFLGSILLLANLAVFIYLGTRINLVFPLATLLTNGTFIIAYKYLVEEKKARDIKHMFSSYVTKRVVDELVAHPEMAKLGGERREITVLFSDISGFTTFSEKHEPEEVVAMLNEYLNAMTDVIFRWEGTLDKFIGDAIVAFWGAPMAQENHAELAVRCSLHMMKKLEELQKKWISEGKAPLSMGIGMNTGEVLVGNIGAEGKKMDYTVIGDNVNIGARVESLTRKYNTDILITELTYNKIAGLVTTCKMGHISVNGVGSVVVKGKEKPIVLYEIKTLDPASESIITECSDSQVTHYKEK